MSYDALGFSIKSLRSLNSLGRQQQIHYYIVLVYSSEDLQAKWRSCELNIFK